ncbi:ABC transporter permease [Bosea sp. (in: a-proteobacteria)]|uniref:ABC transporter permease n=1 Tax=Bosea sp. (in: a-proteobacteria) TaxID=1871050 RepID=UPI003B3ADD69
MAISTPLEPRSPARREGRQARGWLPALALLGPAILFFLLVFVLPVGLMLRFSFLKQLPDGSLTTLPTLANYIRLATVDLYRGVLLTTLRISLLTTIGAVLLAYPLALVIARGPAILGRIITMLVIAPLLVNVVVRAYGWRVILANGPGGVLNWLLSFLGLGPVELLYSDWAVVIGSVQVFLPMMVLPLAAAIGRIDPAVEDAARTLGGDSLAVFRWVTLPLSLPGLGAGCTLVFSLTASSFILPSLLGGSFTKMLGTLVEEQILTVFDWPFGAAIATVMVVIVMAINLGYMALIERRVPTRAKGAA